MQVDVWHSSGIRILVCKNANRQGLIKITHECECVSWFKQQREQPFIKRKRKDQCFIACEFALDLTTEQRNARTNSPAM